MRLLTRLVLCLLPLTLSAANLVFVFNSSTTTANVYDGDSMLLVGTPTVGAGAVKAVGVPDPNNPNQFLKIYVITTSSITVLNGTAPFALRATLLLSGPVASGPNAVVLSPDARRLLVAGGSNVHVVNTFDSPDAFATMITTVASPTGIVVLPNSKRAYVMSPPSAFVQIIDLVQAPPALLSISANLPIGAAPSAIGIAPNGSRIYVAAFGAIYDIDRVSNAPAGAISNLFSSPSSISFDPDPPVSNAVLNGGTSASILNLPTRLVSLTPFTVSGGTQTITKVVTPGGNRAFLIAGSPGRLYYGFLSAGGAAQEVINPITATAFGTTVVDMEASQDGTRLFVAFTADNRLVKLDPSGAFSPTQVSLSQAPSGVSAISTPSPVASFLEIYGGDAQTGPASTVFPSTLAVRARVGSTPAVGQTVTFTPLTAGVSVSDSTAVTNIAGVAETQVTVLVTTPVQVQAQSGIVSPVTFNLNSGTPTNPGGLTKVSGDRQLVLQNTSFTLPLVVQAGGGNVLAVTAPSGITCTTPVTADLATGQASVTCSAGAFAVATSVDINMTDAFGRTLADAFHAKVVLLASDLPTALSLNTANPPLVTTVRQTLPSALQIVTVKADGTPVPDVGVKLFSPQDVSFNPPLVVTNAGITTASITFGCFLGTGQINATASSPGLPSNSISFTTLVGPATQLVKKQGDNQRGNARQLLNGAGQALKVQVTDDCGNPLPNQAVSWTVSPAGFATLESVFSTTDFQGYSSVLVRLGTQSGSFNVIAISGGLSATFTITVNVIPTRLSVISGNNQTVSVGQAADPLTVIIQDDSGVGVPGLDVVFAVTSGTATLDSTRVTTDAQGRATTILRAGNVVGTVTVTATAISRSVIFTITLVGRMPVVSALGFVNGASFRQGWVSGSLGTIFGTGLMEGIIGAVLADRAPFPTTLRGVRITVQGIDAPLISLINQQGQEQINLQVPFGLPLGGVTVVINNNGSQKTFTVQIVSILPGIFEFDSGGQRLAAALHADFSVVTQSNPARAGEIILLFLTGLGALVQQVGTNVAGPVPAVATVTRPLVGINDQGVQVLGSFYAPGLYTAYQINFVVSDNTPSGIAKLSVVADGVASQDSKLWVQSR